MPTRVQTADFDLSANGAPLVLSLTAPPTPGNRLVFIVSTSGSPWAAVPNGTTLDAHGDDAGRFTDLYSREVVSGDGLEYTFTPTGATAAGRGFIIELAPSTPGNKVVPRAGAVSEATSAASRVVDLPASPVSGSLYGVAAVGLGGTSGGSDTVSAPWTTLTPPGAFDSGRMHVARYAMTGTDLPAATFSWLTARRCVAVAVAYGEEPPADPNVVLPAGLAPLDTVLITQPSATAGTGPFTYDIAEVDAGGVLVDNEAVFARPVGGTGREWAVPKNTAETYWRVTATSSTGKTAARTYAVAAQGAGGGPTFGLYFNNGSSVVPITAA